jgi:hypothetical protein
MTAAGTSFSISAAGARAQIWWAACTALLIAGVSLEAQEPTRAGTSREERERKREDVRPYEPGRLERWLHQLEDRYLAARLFDPRQGLFVRVGGLPQGAGFSAGPAYRVTARPLVVTASAVHSIRGYWEGDVNGRLSFLPVWEGGLTVGVKRRHLPHEDFFGLGSESLESGRTAYRIDDTTGYIVAAVKPWTWMALELRGEHRAVSLGRGEDARVPSVEDVFSPDAAPGLGASPDVLSGGARVVFDYTDRVLGPPSGGEYSVEWVRAAEAGGDRVGFHRWRADLRQYVPIVPGARTIAARVVLEGVRPVGGRQIPFYYLPVLGGSNTLRGLPSYRLRDRHAALAQLEYRFEMNEFLTGVVFYDAGRVAHDWDRLFRGRFEQDGGLGLRFGFSTNVFLRTEVVYGSQGLKLLVRFSDVF